jgi:hypothetical protein
MDFTHKMMASYLTKYDLSNTRICVTKLFSHIRYTVQKCYTTKSQMTSFKSCRIGSGLVHMVWRVELLSYICVHEGPIARESFDYAHCVFWACIKDSNEVPNRTPMFSGSGFPTVLFPLFKTLKMHWWTTSGSLEPSWKLWSPIWI